MEERGGLAAAAFALLPRWSSVNAAHGASLPESNGYLCDRKKDGE